MSVPFGLTGGSWIFAAFLVVFFFALVFSYYTRRGSGINQRPYADLDRNSGPERPSQLAHDVTTDIAIWERGVGARRRRTPPPPRAWLDDDELRSALEAWRAGDHEGKLAALDRPALPSRGPDDGADIVVFWDYLAPDAGPLAFALERLRGVTPIRETALHLPIADVNPVTFQAALTVEAGRLQDRFWDIHDALLSRRVRTEPEIDAVQELVDDPARLHADIEAEAGRERVFSHINLATLSGAHGVPAVFIDGMPFDGEPDAGNMASAINARRGAV